MTDHKQIVDDIIKDISCDKKWKSIEEIEEEICCRLFLENIRDNRNEIVKDCVDILKDKIQKYSQASKEAYARYSKTENGKERRSAACRKYRQTEKGQKWTKEYMTKDDLKLRKKYNDRIKEDRIEYIKMFDC